ncbi:unnamed protein product [Euphydryas editha]|uniref:Uncharacterized protein n=1 Tax=Euphydryas editha TaxID=104508 RepID=A0AAU9TK92_EUPED|nr:unnamed protein product [Euphydryas editha]
MKRTQMPRIINSSFNISPFNNLDRNVIYPNVVDPIAININEIKPTIEIIEINSDESEKQSPQNNNSFWSHVISEDEKSQTKSKGNVTDEQNYTYDSENQVDDLNATFNSHCGGDSDKHKIYYNRVDYLTIINNNITSDTSSDDRYDDIEIIHFNDAVDDYLRNSNSYTIVARDDDSKNQREWIYSLKDTKYSYENNYEPSNVSSNDSTSCSTVTDDDETIKNRSVFSTPVFNWIPKLNLLSSPLPTVTELTEPYKQSSSDNTEGSSTHKFVKKSANSWFEAIESDRDQCRKQTEILTKLSTLSQRERRRNKVANILNKQTENKEQVSVYCEPGCNSTSSFENMENKITKTDKSNITEVIINEDTVNEIDEDEVKVFDATKKLCLDIPKVRIECKSQPTVRTNEMSDPIELEENWLNNNNNNTEVIDVYDYDLDTVINSGKENVTNEESNSNCTFISKSVDLPQNVTLQNTVPYLHLSLETDFDDDKSCFKRFVKFINCCK